MKLDRNACRRARLARDPRFDGRFFVGVRTTGVYCRPICPAVPPRERNVEYFPSAAAAAAAGFRACLRCRPECAPGTPAWKGAPATVARALRLIDGGCCETSSVEALAARLGVGARHLRRLFLEHLGASPIAVDQTRRLLSAKRLIDETDMPMTAVALSAGYRSIRRFNAAFLESYGRSPRELRAMSPARARSGRDRAFRATFSLQLRYRPPLDWDALTAFLAPRAIPGIEAVERGVYRRTIELEGRAGRIQVQPGRPGALDLRLEFPDPSRMLGIVARVRRMFDLDADPMIIDTHLAGDPLLAPLVKLHPGLRVPGAWDGFELGVRAILGQQVSVAAATTLSGRLVAAFGRRLTETDGALTHVFPSPGEIARSDAARIGIPKRRGEAIRRFASECGVSFNAWQDTGMFRTRLRALPGIGEWTEEYIALRALGDPDAFPAGDLGLLHASGATTPGKLKRRAEAWRPWRAYAAVHLWTASAGRKPGAAKGDKDGYGD